MGLKAMITYPLSPFHNILAHEKKEHSGEVHHTTHLSPANEERATNDKKKKSHSKTFSFMKKKHSGEVHHITHLSHANEE